MTQDLVHKRPFLLLSLLFGLSYPAASYFQIAGGFEIIWKMCAIGFLVPYALRRHHNGDFILLAVILAFCSLGDGLVQVYLEMGAIAFGIAHILAIYLYSKYRRPSTSFSQKALALVVLIVAPFLAYMLAGNLAAGYTLLLSLMAAMAWTSSFPRYRVGIGVMLFVISDLFLFAREGGVLASFQPINLIVWYTYYVGVLLIAIGIVQTLVKTSNHN